MKLSQYLVVNSLTKEQFGRKVGVKRLAIFRYINGDRAPSPKVARKIVKVTGGDVTFEDLYK